MEGGGVEALRFLQQAQHIGKVVVTQRSTMGLGPLGAYVITGGMGALVAGLKALPEGVPHPARTARPSPGVLEGDIIVGVNGVACAALRDIVTAIKATTGSLGLVVYRRAQAVGR